jgi:hypothetical protein
MGYKVLHKVDNKNYIWRPSTDVYKIYFDGVTPTPTPTIDDCPAPWMKILLSNGEKIPAGDLKVGMKVKTYHEETMEYGDYSVSFFKTLTCKRILLKFDHVDFVCSESHKFYLNNTWIKAKELKVGDVVSGHKLEKISDYDIGEVVKITVDDAHTYICENLLSHNKSPITTPTPTVTPTCSNLTLYNSGTEYYTFNAVSIFGSPTLTKSGSALVIAGSNDFGSDNAAFISSTAIDLTGRSKLRVYYTYTDTSSSGPCCSDSTSFTIALLDSSSYSDIAFGGAAYNNQALTVNYNSPIDLSFSYSGSKYIMVQYYDSKINGESLSVSITNISLIC